MIIWRKTGSSGIGFGTVCHASILSLWSCHFSLSFLFGFSSFFLSLSFAVSKRGLVSCKAAGKMASMGGTWWSTTPAIKTPTQVCAQIRNTQSRCTNTKYKGYVHKYEMQKRWWFCWANAVFFLGGGGNPCIYIYGTKYKTAPFGSL